MKREIYIVACGTSAVTRSTYYKNFTGIKTDVDIAGNLNNSDPFIDEKVLVIFINRQGETLDTIMAIWKWPRTGS